MASVCLAAVPGIIVLPLLYGAQFNDARIQALILLPGVFLVSIAGVLANHFSGTGMPILVPFFSVTALLFDMALNFLLVPSSGARGAAVASAASYSLLFLLITIYFRARTRNSLREAFVLKKTELQGMLAMLRLRTLN
jgi:O-antigen/teichoic acid export membrane protein